MRGIRRRSSCRLDAARQSAFVCAVVACAGSALATGPREQIVANGRAATLDSVVQIRSKVGGLGSGSIIFKTANGGGADEWIGVLTAAHNFLDGAGNFVRGGHRIRTGTARDGLSTMLGGPGNAWAWNHPTIDVGVLAVRYGPADAAYAGITPIARAPWTPTPGGAAADPTGLGRTTMRSLPGDVFHQFTEVGYGGTGWFQNAAGQRGVSIVNPGPPVRYTANIDHNKRFQNNALDWTWDGANTSGRAGESYRAVEWDMDLVTAATVPFLKGEGLSWVGDSGGPYLAYSGPLVNEMVNAYNRPGGENWAGGAMQLASNFLIAVHTYGNSVPRQMSLSRENPYGTTIGGGVPLTPWLNNIINQRLNFVPSPGAVSLVGIGGMLVAARRRRT